MVLKVGQALELYRQFKAGEIDQGCFVQNVSKLSGHDSKYVKIGALNTKLARYKNIAGAKRGSYKEAYLDTQFLVPTETVVNTIPEPEVDSSVVDKLTMSLEKMDKKVMEKTRKLRQQQYVSKDLSRKHERARIKLLKFPPTVKENASLQKERKKMVRNIEQLENQVLRGKRFREEALDAKMEVKRLKRENVKLTKSLSLLENSQKEMVASQESAAKERDQLEMDLLKVKKQNSEVEESCQYLENIVNDNSEIHIFDHQRYAYTPKCMEVIMNLDNLNVANRNIGPVIEEVLKLADMRPNKTPCRQTIDNIISAKCIVASKHISQVIPDQKSTTLYTDETSKFGKCYNVYAVTDDTRTPYLLGLREMSNKSSQTALNTFQEILEDLSAGDKSEAGNMILSNIVNTMSDRAQTEVAFNKLLEDYRTTVLPKVKDCYAELTDNERNALGKMNNFFCGLHLLVHFADVSAKVLLKFECVHGDTIDQTDGENEDNHPDLCGESRTIRLIRAASKCLSRGGDEKSGCHGQFKTYCESKKETVLFVRFRGNRFNIVFLLAQILHYQRSRILDFFTNYHEPSNRLQKAVINDLKVPLLQAGVKVLGLVSKLISAPLWRLLESDINILEMNQHYQDLHTYLTTVSKAASDFLTGKTSPFPDNVERDKVFTSLCCEEDIDEIALPMAQAVCTSLADLLSRMVKDQLIGGKFWSPSPELQIAANSVVPHNKLPEFIFGQLDFLMRYRPNASTLVNECFVMYSLNRTSEWLQTLNTSDKEELLQEARKEGRVFRQQFRNRCQEIRRERLEKLHKNKTALEKKTRMLLHKKESLTGKIVFYGLWQSVAQVQTSLEELASGKQKRDALCTQLKFRKSVLNQKHKDKFIFNQTEKVAGKYKTLSLGKLTANLCELVTCALEGPSEEIGRGPKKPLLVGKKISHTFNEGNWEGYVVSVVPGYPEWYNVVYNGDPAVYSYRLMDDYRQGNLQIIL